MPLVIKPTRINEASLLTIETFASRFTIEDNGCWEWRGYKNKHGYGLFSVKGKAKFVHRVMWELSGRVPDLSKQLDHLCRNPACLNPKHLEEVSGYTNTMRGNGPTKLNSLKTHCSNGHEFSGWNLISARGYRACRTCVNKWNNNYYHKTRSHLLDSKEKNNV